MLLIDSLTKDLSPWISALKRDLGDEVITWEQLQNPNDVKAAIVWNHRPELFEFIPDVPLICSLGAGVDHILKDPKVPRNAYITRIISEHLSGPMSNFCIGAILFYQRKFDQYLKDKATRRWNQEFDPERDLRVGIMGMGVLGTDLAIKLNALGFQVAGWSQTRKEIKGISSHIKTELDDFLERTDLLVCMLPATPDTKGILSADLFRRMNRGSYLLNVARGHHQVNQDIVEALNTGQLAGAFLDVFPEEPLPASDPLWDHPDVFITPHIAVVTKIEAAVPQIVENYRRIQRGEIPLNTINRKKGY
jgi:glyoxylate/hydroxypyruvate reductase A